MEKTTEMAKIAKPVTVAVLDTGIYEDHQLLKDKMLRGSQNFVSGGKSYFCQGSWCLFFGDSLSILLVFETI